MESTIYSILKNSGSGKEIMTLLLDRRGDDVHITEGVVQAAAKNSGSGNEIMTLLLDRRGDDRAPFGLLLQSAYIAR